MHDLQIRGTSDVGIISPNWLVSVNCTLRSRITGAVTATSSVPGVAQADHLPGCGLLSWYKPRVLPD